MAERGGPKGATGRQKTGGRRLGSKNKVGDAMRMDIMRCYRSLGGVRWLEEWARENPTEFVGKVLKHVLPVPPRDDSEPTAPPLLADTTLSDIEVARRIAFALSKGMLALDQAKTIEGEMVDAEPFEPCGKPILSPEVPPHTLEVYPGGPGEQPSRRRKLL